MAKVRLGNEFGLALCQHFGLPTAQTLGVLVNASRDDVFGVSIEMALTSDDLAGIAKHMGAGNPEQSITIVNKTSSPLDRVEERLTESGERVLVVPHGGGSGG